VSDHERLEAGIPWKRIIGREEKERWLIRQ
jgi:hypothetical protein